MAKCNCGQNATTVCQKCSKPTCNRHSRLIGRNKVKKYFCPRCAPKYNRGT